MGLRGLLQAVTPSTLRERDLAAGRHLSHGRPHTDVRPVLDTIVRSALRFCGGLFCALFQLDGELMHQVAQHNFMAGAREDAGRSNRAFARVLDGSRVARGSTSAAITTR